MFKVDLSGCLICDRGSIGMSYMHVAVYAICLPRSLASFSGESSTEMNVIPNPPMMRTAGFEVAGANCPAKSAMMAETIAKVRLYTVKRIRMKPHSLSRFVRFVTVKLSDRSLQDVKSMLVIRFRAIVYCRVAKVSKVLLHQEHQRQRSGIEVRSLKKYPATGSSPG